MSARSRRAVAAAAAWASLLSGACGARPPAIGAAKTIAPGIDLFEIFDPALVSGDGPIAVRLLRLDPARARVTSALSNDEVMDAEPVDQIARRRQAVAAVNGGYFNRANGDPMGLLKVDGEIVSDSSLARGAVIINSPASGRTTIAFDRLSAKLTARFHAKGREWESPIDGVDTTRERGKLMLYTPAYHADTDTAPTGVEWVIDGDPLQVVQVRPNGGRTPIPRHGMVLSFGGVDLPGALAAVAPGAAVTFHTAWKSGFGASADELNRAPFIVSGAGLLRRNGTVIDDWRAEGLNPDTFPAARHPRTFIGVDDRGLIWLGAVDGRQPDYSIGMTFAELERLCDRLSLQSALNLDGGGSTTMVVNGAVVNRPSDPTGLRPVSDALIVTRRP